MSLFGKGKDDNSYKCQVNPKDFQELCNNVKGIKYFLGASELSSKDILHSIVYNDETYYFYDIIDFSDHRYMLHKHFINMLDANKNNIDNPYNFCNIPFKEGDVVLDVGAHIGTESIYLAKKYPFIKIIAFEPSIRNYENLVKNIDINDVKNVVAENMAVSSKNEKVRFFSMLGNMASPHIEGAMNANILSNKLKERSGSFEVINSINLESIFEKYNLKKVKLLKIDCEGAEFDIFYNTEKLKDIEYLTGEAHASEEKNIELIKFIKQYFPKEKYAFEYFSYAGGRFQVKQVNWMEDIQ